MERACECIVMPPLPFLSTMFRAAGPHDGEFDFNNSAYIPSNDGFPIPDFNAAGKFNMDAFNAQWQAVDKQFTRKLLCGTITDAELADAKAKLEAVGVKDLLGLQNADYQTWKAK